jgi:16S rRNA (cytidine1402-2'-O)-methyltransferase
MNTPGTLYIVPTPIGNLKDITYRAIEVLGLVDLVAAEDTRNTLRLLSHFNISKPLISYHDHSEREKSGGLIEKLKTGTSIALVSDGGMPLISDPGYILVQKCISEEIPLEVLPGPAAFVNALVLSGLPVARFVFEGYPSRNPAKRRKLLRLLIEEKRTMIFYESPHRIIKTLHDMQTILGDRPCAVLREMTKKFEEHFRGNVSSACMHFESKGVKGEFVIVVAGADGMNTITEDEESSDE